MSSFEYSGFDIHGWDQILITDVIGLELLKCANWAEGSTHGGIITTNEVDFLFDDISDAENMSGVTDYRKVFIKATEGDVLNKICTPYFILPELLESRLSITIAAGTSSDNMTNKPSDETFANSLNIDITSGNSQSIWLKRTISATAEQITYIRNVSVVLTVDDIS